MIAKPTVATVTMTSANVEVSYTIPAGTRKVRFKLRALNALLRFYGTVSGGTPFITIPYGDFHDLEVKAGGDTYYFQSPSASQTLEVLTWR
ncbi:hypothetical protein LCGC14_1260560 [marine sediment metagenome]|uniref:Uncharacterized protein n=1 Tax=marine sediment metagenome TaxID=412755 RepID=A0A0F9NHL6_9ZZZZ